MVVALAPWSHGHELRNARTTHLVGDRLRLSSVHRACLRFGDQAQPRGGRGASRSRASRRSVSGNRCQCSFDAPAAVSRRFWRAERPGQTGSHRTHARPITIAGLDRRDAGAREVRTNRAPWALRRSRKLRTDRKLRLETAFHFGDRRERQHRRGRGVGRPKVTTTCRLREGANA